MNPSHRKYSLAGSKFTASLTGTLRGETFSSSEESPEQVGIGIHLMYARHVIINYNEL